MGRTREIPTVYKWAIFICSAATSCYAEVSLPSPSTASEFGSIMTAGGWVISLVLYFLVGQMCMVLDKKQELNLHIAGFHIGIFIGQMVALFDTNTLGIFRTRSLIMAVWPGFRNGPFAVLLWSYIVLIGGVILGVLLAALFKCLRSCCEGKKDGRGEYEVPPQATRGPVPVRAPAPLPPRRMTAAEKYASDRLRVDPPG